MTRLTRMIAVAVAMTLFLSFMVAGHAHRRATGTEVLLEMLPRDPRDFFLGHYSRVQTGLDRLAPGRLAGDNRFDIGDDIYVVLEPDEDGSWQPVSLHADRPAEGVFAHGMIRLIAPRPWQRQAEDTPQSDTPEQDGAEDDRNVIHARFNIDRLYLSADRARALDAQMLDLGSDIEGSPMRLIISIPADGNAVIKGIEINGERIIDRLW
jgi:hypothetical protein